MLYQYAHVTERRYERRTRKNLQLNECSNKIGLLAQLEIERRATNAEVWGSSPRGSANSSVCANMNKCVACGKFKAWDELTETHFIPLNEFGPEESEFTCKKCLSLRSSAGQSGQLLSDRSGVRIPS